MHVAAVRCLIAGALLLVSFPQGALAQEKKQPNGNQVGGGQNITVQGVYIDAKRMLRYRQPAGGIAGKFRRDKKAGNAFVVVSLPKLFAQVKKLHAAGKPIPQKMRLLDGMVKLKYVVLDAEKKDLLIAGPAEPIDDNNPARPRGKRTGRPVLQLEDLIVALRTVGPGRRARAFGCTLVHDPQAVGRVAALQKSVRTIRAGSQGRLQTALKKAIGPLNAKFFGVPADSRKAFVCVECDYRMKRISLGLDQTRVRGLRSYASLTGGGSLFNRFWFTADYPPLPVSKDGTIIGIPERGLKLHTSTSTDGVKKTNSAATKFAETFTKKLPDLEQVVPGFADLQNLADLALLAALIDTDRLDRKAGWDLSWVLKSDAYRVAKYPTPRQAETLVNIATRGRRTVTVAGGVQLSVRRFAARRRTDAMKKAAEYQLTIGNTGWSRRLKTVKR